jgi:hypothetical protein
MVLKKNIIIILLSLFSYSVSSQFLQIDLSSGLIQSDIRGGVGGINNECNSTKIGWFTSFGIDYKIKRWLKVKCNINYQERKAIEVFTFPTGGNLGIGQHSFCKYPTSPQSEIYDPKIYKHFPNFKYSNVELIPHFSLGNRLRIELGLGAFFGVLLNRNKLLFSKKDLSIYEQPFFAPPFNLFGEVRYQRFDLGLLPMISLSYRVNQRFDLNIQSKYYYSLRRLNDTFVESAIKSWNTYWSAYSFGLGISWNLK